MIHPTAIISPEAELAPDVRVGPFVIVEGHVKVGAGCVLRPRSHLIGPVTMGKNNFVGENTVIGGRPQHLGYKDEPTSVEIGDGNIFRENVTIHKATAQAMVTRLGNENFLLAGSHVGHDCQVGNRCMLVNNCLLGGHVTVEDNVIISGGSGVHQFCRVGRLAFLSGASGTSKDIPPFIVQQNINIVVGVNVIGMRRAGMIAKQINAIRKLYHVVYLKGLTLPNALLQAEQELGDVDAVQEFIRFARASKRGINGTRTGDSDLAVAA